MAHDRLVDEIRQAHAASRRSGEILTSPPAPAAPPTRHGSPPDSPAPAAAPPPRDPRASLRHLISELATRLDRTQEQLLARLGDLNDRARPGATAPPLLETGLLEDILTRLDAAGAAPIDSRLDERLSSLESLLHSLPTELAERRTDAPEFETRLGSLESAIRAVGSAAASSADVAALAARLESLPSRAAETATAGAPPVVASDLAALEKRLERIEERLGGDAGAVTLGAALSRLAEKLDRIEGALSALGSAPRPAGLGSLDERIDRIIESSLDPLGGSADAKQSVAMLERDVSLLARTIQGHLQESRDRGAQIEAALDGMKSALQPVTRQAGLDLGRA